jgi:hypothetical protein
MKDKLDQMNLFNSKVAPSIKYQGN